MAEFRAGGLYAQIVHNDLFAGVHAKLILPAASHDFLIHDDFHLFRRGSVGTVWPVKALDTEYLLSNPALTGQPDILCKQAALVHERHTDAQAQTVAEAVNVADYIVKLPPGIRIVGPPANHAVANPPRFPEMTMPQNFKFQPVILGIHAAGQDENALRQFNIVSELGDQRGDLRFCGGVRCWIAAGIAAENAA